ncbi:MAG: ATP-dependent helicase HrpB, partial [Bacteroidota bacterium]
MRPARLPIDAVLPEVLDALRARPSAVLQAPPGAGKTTRVPLALLDAPWLAGQRIVMLEPRRLAARAAAQRMARTLDERVGETVGYRVRRDARVSPQTRIEVITEGILTRLLQSDPGLDGVGCVIFDEFHERSLAADLGLALTLDVARALRDDLRVLVMSATLDGARVSALLSEATGQPSPLVTSHGRTFPVATHYLGGGDPRDPRPTWRTTAERVVHAVQRALRDEPGSVLAFLPGAGEIRRAQDLLRASNLPSDVIVAPLFGVLDQRAQDEAIAPAPPGTRKVVLATPIAESSLTIDGVRVVVDCGYARAPRFSPRSGMTSLETVRISRASADQRRGRAGRTEPGVCYRLWSRLDQEHLAPFSSPEIADADLAPLALELAVWGVTDAASLPWLDAPSPAALAQASALLHQLDAVDRHGAATAHGRAMARLGLHPRLAHLLVRGVALDLGATACAVAAVLGERDPVRTNGPATADADLRLRLDLLARGPSAPLPSGHRVDRGVLHRIRAEADHLKRTLGVRAETVDPEAAGLLVAFAYPDRIAQRVTPENRFRLRTGHAAALSHDQVLSDSPYLAVASLDERQGAAKIFAAAPLALDDLDEHFADHLATLDLVRWDSGARRVIAQRHVQLGALVVREGPLDRPEPEAVTSALLDGIREHGLDVLPWTKEARRVQARLQFLHHQRPAEWRDMSDGALLRRLEPWLAPYLVGHRRFEDLRSLNLVDLLLAPLDWPRR